MVAMAVSEITHYSLNSHYTVTTQFCSAVRMSSGKYYTLYSDSKHPTMHREMWCTTDGHLPSNIYHHALHCGRTHGGFNSRFNCVTTVTSLTAPECLKVCLSSCWWAAERSSVLDSLCSGAGMRGWFRHNLCSPVSHWLKFNDSVLDSAYDWPALSPLHHSDNNTATSLWASVQFHRV